MCTKLNGNICNEIIFFLVYVCLKLMFIIVYNNILRKIGFFAVYLSEYEILKIRKNACRERVK